MWKLHNQMELCMRHTKAFDDEIVQWRNYGGTQGFDKSLFIMSAWHVGQMSSMSQMSCTKHLRWISKWNDHLYNSVVSTTRPRVGDETLDGVITCFRVSWHLKCISNQSRDTKGGIHTWWGGTVCFPYVLEVLCAFIICKSFMWMYKPIMKHHTTFDVIYQSKTFEANFRDFLASWYVWTWWYLALDLLYWSL